MSNSTNERKEAVNRFFATTPKTPSYGKEYGQLAGGGVVLLVGVIIVGASVSQGGGAGACCGVMFLIGGLVLGILGLVKYAEKRGKYQREYDQAEPKPPVRWIRDLLREDLQWLERRALESLGIVADDLRIEGDLQLELRKMMIASGQIPSNDTTKHPVIIVGPERGTRVAQDDEQGSLLFERCAVTVICPTESQFSVYECTLNLDTGMSGTEQTLQYPYGHVAAVSTTTVPLSIFKRGEPGDALMTNYDAPLTHLEFQLLKIQVSSGNAAEISCGLLDQRDKQTSMSSFMPDFPKVTEAVRAALRQRGAFGQPSRTPF